MKVKGTIRHVVIKQENDKKKKVSATVGNISTKVEEYVDKQYNHFYTKTNNINMVEMHVDDVYMYKNDKGNLPLLGPYGGNLSVRLLTGKKPLLVFG